MVRWCTSGTSVMGRPGRSSRRQLAHATKCISLGDLKERKILKLYARDCKNPVISVFNCIKHGSCVPYRMRTYPGYVYCKSCSDYSDGKKEVPVTYCTFIKKSHGKHKCASCGRVITHQTGKIKIKCKARDARIIYTS